MLIETIIKEPFENWKKEDSKEPVEFFGIDLEPAIEIENIFEADFNFEMKKRGQNANN